MTTRNHWLSAACLGLSLLFATTVRADIGPGPASGSDIAGWAVQFPGTGSVEVPDSTVFQVNALTIETWFRWEEAPDASPQFLVAKAYENLEIHISTATHGLRFIPTAGVYIDTPIFILSQSAWYHVACVYDPSVPLAKIYLNGVDTGAAIGGFNPLTTPLGYVPGVPFRMGNRQSLDYPFRGVMDEVRVWNYARTQAQIQETMAIPLAGPQPGLVGSWHFNEGEGPITVDDAGNNLTGVLVPLGFPGPIWTGSSVALVPLLDTVGAVVLALLLVGGATVILRRRQALLLTRHAS